VIAGFFFVPKWLNQETKGPVSIAIVPFHNQTNDPKLTTLGFGMATEIRTELSLSGQFEFISSDQATLKYASSNLSPKEIGEELKVDYLLIGSFYQIGDKLKVNSELSETATNKSLWSFPIDFTSRENMKEVFSVKTEISKRVMDWFSLKAKTTLQAPTNNPIAYQYYLEAIQNDDKSLPIAGEQFRRSIELDSNFLSAQLGLFLFEDGKLWSNGSDTLIRENDLRPLLNRIEKIAPDSWETMLAKGVFFYHQLKDYEKGLAFFEKSMHLNPDGQAVGYAAAVNRRRLNLEEAFRLRLKSIKANPRAASSWNELAMIFANNGNARDALKAELIGNHLALEQNFSSFMSYNMALRDSSLHELPVSIKNYLGTFYSSELAIEQRDWNKLLAIADTANASETFTEYDRQMSKAYAYYMMDNLEKARQAATLAAKEVNNKWFLNRAELIYVMMGKKEKALNHYKEHLAGSFVTESHNQQDVAEFCGRLVDWIQLQSFAGEYEAATQSLIQLNRDYPKFGGYQILSTGVLTFKIRQAYPPFNEALRNLKLPPKLKMPDEYSDM